MKDLFGNTVHEIPVKKIRKYIPSPKVNPMIHLHGAYPDPDVKCKACAHLYTKQYAHKYYKCKFRRDDGSQSSDHKRNYRACNKFEKK